MMRIEKIIMSWSPGTIYDMLDESVILAKQNNCMVEFPFNGVIIAVTKDTDPDEAHFRVLDAVKMKSERVRV